MKKLLTCTAILFALFFNSGTGEAKEFPYVEITNDLRVSPKGLYEEDSTYRLVIKGRSKSGEQLSEKSTLTFKYVPYKSEN